MASINALLLIITITSLHEKNTEINCWFDNELS